MAEYEIGFNSYANENDDGLEEVEGIVSSTGSYETGLFLKRKRYAAKNGEKYWMYFTTYRSGKDTKEIRFTAGKKDKNVYETLAEVFGYYEEIQKPVPISIEISSFTNNDNQKQVVTKTFVSYRPMPDVPIDWKVYLKPMNPSDIGGWTFFIEYTKYRLGLTGASAKASESAPPSEEPVKKSGKAKSGEEA